MAEMMNWPPSRGPNPHERTITYRPGQVTREDIPMEPSPAAAAEREIIEAAAGVPEEENGAQWRPEEPPAEEPAPMAGRWRVWYQVDDVASLTLEQAVNLLSGKKVEPEEDDFDSWFDAGFGTLRTMIDYPLSKAVFLTIEPMVVTWSGGNSPERTEREMRLGYFLWIVAKEYERIYREHEKYGVWGHALSDLGFEGVVVREDGTVDLIIGS